MAIKVIEDISAMRQWSKEQQKEGFKVALVPTMGALHEGHLSLIKKAKECCDKVVVSIFVNPVQFCPGEDFAKYPRDLKGDSEKAEGAGADIIFYPQDKKMYPSSYDTFVNVGTITDKLCGASRPGHFRGVATVITKFLHIIAPQKIFFGQKDAQQVLVIKKMVRELNFDVEVEMVPIVREKSGLALSSRNQYLSEKERAAATVLSKSLALSHALVQNGENKAEKICARVADFIGKEPLANIEYVKIYSYPDLEAVDEIKAENLLALAVRFGKTRLIDNTILRKGEKCC